MRSRDVTNTSTYARLRADRVFEDFEILRVLYQVTSMICIGKSGRTFRPMMRLLFPPERRPRLRALPLGLDLAKCAIRF